VPKVALQGVPGVVLGQPDSWAPTAGQNFILAPGHGDGPHGESLLGITYGFEGMYRVDRILRLPPLTEAGFCHPSAAFNPNRNSNGGFAIHSIIAAMTADRFTATIHA